MYNLKVVHLTTFAIPVTKSTTSSFHFKEAFLTAALRHELPASTIVFAI